MNAHTKVVPGVGEAQVVARIERLDSLEHVCHEWTDLAAERGGIFATWEWADAWWRHFGRDRELLLHASRSDDGRLVAVLPLYAWRERRPRVIRFVGHGPGDELGPIHRVGAQHLAASGLRAALDDLVWDVFLGEQLPQDERWSEMLIGQTWRRESAPILHVPSGGWPEYLATRSRNFRQQLEKRRRRVEAAGTVEFRLATRASLGRDLDTLFALHRARWGSRPTDFRDMEFHRQVAAIALERGWLRLWLLELDGRPVAAWHGFHVGRVTNYYQAGRDPAFDDLSPGFVLLAHTLRAAMEENASEYHFGRGAEAFKFRFTQEDPGLESVALARGAIGRSTLAIAHGLRPLRRAHAWARSLVRRP